MQFEFDKKKSDINKSKTCYWFLWGSRIICKSPPTL